MGVNKCVADVISDELLLFPAEDAQVDPPVCILWGPGWVLFELQSPAAECLDGGVY
jgi:hypothetical protein